MGPGYFPGQNFWNLHSDNTFDATKTPWRPESIAQLWRKHWWPKAMGILRPGRSPSFSCVFFRCFLFLAFACLPNWILPCCFLKPTPVPIPFILHLYPNLDIHIFIYNSIPIYMYVYIYIYLHTYTYMRIYNAIWITQGPIQKLCNNNRRKLGKIQPWGMIVKNYLLYSISIGCTKITDSCPNPNLSVFPPKFFVGTISLPPRWIFVVFFRILKEILEARGEHHLDATIFEHHLDDTWLTKI